MEPDQQYVANLKQLIRLASNGTFDTHWANNGMLNTFLDKIQNAAYRHWEVEAMCAGILLQGHSPLD